MKYIEIVIYMMIVRTDLYMEETGRINSLEKFPYLQTLTRLVTDETLEMWEKQEGIQAERYGRLLRTLGDGKTVDPVIHTAFDLCLAATCLPEFAGYLEYYTGSAASLQLAFEMENDAFPSYAEMKDKLNQLQKICHIDWNRSHLSKAILTPDHRLLSYLFVEDNDHNLLSTESYTPMKSGSKTLPECAETMQNKNDMTHFPLFEGGEWFFHDGDDIHPMYVNQEVAQQCAEWMKSEENSTVLQIAGNGGQRFLAKHIAHFLGKNLFMVPIGQCMRFFGEDMEECRDELIRELFWGNGIFCLYGMTMDWFKKQQIEEMKFWKKMVLPILETGNSVVLCTEKRLFFQEGRMLGKRVVLHPLTREERQKVFAGFASLYGLAIDSETYSVRYRLSAGEIARAVELWRHDDSGSEQEFARISTQLLCGDMEKVLGNISYPTVRFSDLKVPEEIQRYLDEICYSVLHGYRIFEEWGLGRQYPYGRAMTVMLSGPPGTGKTMTAHAIAGELGIPLYQIDISKVMDKYIGETEKHLEEIFAFAEKTNVILFFDEADALFGSRGEVREAKDRYANIEVSYILQRVEQFEGIVLLSTNFYKNIDKAFLRRMKYVLKYRMPDKAIRHSIWESCLPAEEFREYLDIDYLAENFEFPGGMIKNVVLGASVMANHEGQLLSMEHILQAIRTEHEKMEWPVSMEMWGEYGYLMI